MLNITFGRENHEPFPFSSKSVYTRYKKPEWFEDELVQKFLKDIDKVTVLKDEAFLDRFGRGISSEMISTGSKTLCLCLFTNFTIFGSKMGDNCIPWLLEICKHKDVDMVLEHWMPLEDVNFEDNVICVNGKRVDFDGYEDAYFDWIESDYQGE